MCSMPTKLKDFFIHAIHVEGTCFLLAHQYGVSYVYHLRRHFDSRLNYSLTAEPGHNNIFITGSQYEELFVFLGNSGL